MKALYLPGQNSRQTRLFSSWVSQQFSKAKDLSPKIRIPTPLGKSSTVSSKRWSWEDFFRWHLPISIGAITTGILGYAGFLSRENVSVVDQHLGSVISELDPSLMVALLGSSTIKYKGIMDSQLQPDGRIQAFGNLLTQDDDDGNVKGRKTLMRAVYRAQNTDIRQPMLYLEMLEFAIPNDEEFSLSLTFKCIDEVSKDWSNAEFFATCSLEKKYISYISPQLQVILQNLEKGNFLGN